MWCVSSSSLDTCEQHTDLEFRLQNAQHIATEDSLPGAEERTYISGEGCREKRIKGLEIFGTVSSEHMKCLESGKIAAASECCLESEQSNSVFQKSMVSEIDNDHAYHSKRHMRISKENASY